MKHAKSSDWIGEFPNMAQVLHDEKQACRAFGSRVRDNASGKTCGDCKYFAHGDECQRDWGMGPYYVLATKPEATACAKFYKRRGEK